MFRTRAGDLKKKFDPTEIRPSRRLNSSILRRRRRPDLEALEERQLLSAIIVTNTNDSGSGSLRAAILQANADTAPDNIEFDIPASTAANLDVPVPGFDPGTQTWRITPLSPLPALTNTVSIDGYSQAHVGGAVPYRYPSQESLAIQSLNVLGSPTGGNFTLSTLAPLPVGTTVAIPYNATAGTVQAALEGLIGTGNVTVTGGPAHDTEMTITFGGAYARQILLPLQWTSSLTGGTNPGLNIATVSVGGTPIASPTLIQSIPNTVAALQGNNAQERVIIDGSLTGGSTGLDIDASHSVVRGLIITNFGVGVHVAATDLLGNPVVGSLIQGNSIGDYFLYLVDTNTGSALPAPNNVAFTAGGGNALQGVVLDSSNTTVGGSNPQENNIICGNGQQGVFIRPGASGNQVLGNQIGLAGPSSDGLYSHDGNGAEGVRIQSSGTLTDPLNIVYSSSNFVLNNLISANAGTGVRIVGVGANRNLVQGNYIGVGPGGGYLFGTGNPGNGDGGDGVRIEDGSLNLIGGSTRDLGNVIDSNHGAGVYITGSAPDQINGIPATGTGNTVANNMIGVTASGTQVLGNSQEGVALYAQNNTIGPGNVISQNLRGIGIYGPTGTLNLVNDNFIGTDIAGVLGFGNAVEGILISNSPANAIQGNATGSQVISGNQIGISLQGSSSTQNFVAGNLIGSDQTGLRDLGNKAEGVLISGATNNTIGGSLASAQNLISANHWGVRIDGAGATANVLQRNYIGTDITGANQLGNEVYGIIISNDASGNTIGGTTAGLGNRIAFQISTGVLVESGIGDSILSNNIFQNGRLGIDLVAPGDPPSGVTANAPGARVGPNLLQNHPVLTSVTSNGTLTHIVGSFNSLPNTTFVIQFFTSPTADPSGFGEGETVAGSTQLTTDLFGNATINLSFASTLLSGAVLSATATNVTTGDTSEFSNTIPQSAAIEFTSSIYFTNENSGSALITVTRTLSIGTSTVQYATGGGSATPGVDYTTTAGTLTFNPGDTKKTFSIPILDAGITGGFKTVNLTLSNPIGGIVDFQPTAVLRINDNDTGTSGVFTVTNTKDAGPGSLRQAILASNATPGSNTIVFAIPASTDPLLDVPVPGFDPGMQTWTITLATSLPIISNTVSIDGYTQAETGVPFRYPSAVSSAVQSVNLTGVVTGGFFTLTVSIPTVSPQIFGTTGPIAYNATASQVQAAISAIPGMAGNVVVTGSAPFYNVTFQGALARLPIPDLTGNSNGLIGLTPGIQIQTTTVGGVAIADPINIISTTNTVQARNGNNARVRVIVDGSQVGGTGFVINASHSILSGLIIDGFGNGVSVPNPTDVGNLAQGNFIGKYLLYPVDTNSGAALPAPDNIILAGLGNNLEGVYLNSNNTTLGGTNPQEDNVISGNGLQGVWIDTAGTGNVVEGNQIGMIGPSDNGLYFQEGNGKEGVLVNGSSNAIGGAGATAANVISGNAGAGVHIVGPIATRTVVGANLIGLAPGGGYLFGTGDPGNGGDGVRIENSSGNQIGGPDSTWGNTISSNGGAGGIL